MVPKMVFLGLGNPEPRYTLTRHNLGFLVLDELADRYRVAWAKNAKTFHAAEFTAESARVLLVKPQTYVNRSGNAVAALRQRRDVSPEKLLVVVDDIALPLGQIRLRRRGSDGGHNGLKSVISELGTTEFPRLRLGLGSVPAGVDGADYVLCPFPDEERETAREMIERAADCLETVVKEGIDRAMGRFNTPPAPGETG
jgi:PTH1 family peptidyl-tRNA hydrolase